MELNKTQASLVLAVATLGIVSALALALFSASKTIPNNGNVKAIGVGVYWYSNCTGAVSLIEWKSLDPGETRNIEVYIRNEGNVDVVLSMKTSNWNPASSSSYMSLSWNRGGYVLGSGASVQAVLTLSVLSTISGVTDFSFDITITGTEST